MAGNIAGWKMVRAESGGEVPPGTTQLDHRGDEWQVRGVRCAPEPGKTGRVAAWRADRGELDLYPHVFGLEIVPDVTVPDKPVAALQAEAEMAAWGTVSGLSAQEAAQASEDIFAAAMARLTGCVAETVGPALIAAYLKGYAQGRAAK